MTHGQFQTPPAKCQLCRQQGHPAYGCKTQFDGRQGNAQKPWRQQAQSLRVPQLKQTKIMKEADSEIFN